MSTASQLKPPQHKIFIRPNQMVAQSFPADIHYESTLFYKDKELRIPMCGAMSTFMTNDIRKCTCKHCMSIFLKKLYDLKISTQQDEGEKEDESKSYRNGFYS